MGFRVGLHALVATLLGGVTLAGASDAPKSIFPAFAPIQFDSDANGAPANQITVEYAFLQELSDGGGNTPIGWNFSYTRNLNASIGLVGEAGTSYESEGGISVALWDFMGGIRLTNRGRTSMTPYLEVLGGIAVIGLSVGDDILTFSDPAMQVGGGVDLKVSSSLSVRAGADYRAIFSNGESFNFLRVRAGVVFDFGGRVGGRRNVPEPTDRPPAPAPPRPTPINEPPPPAPPLEPAPPAPPAEPLVLPAPPEPVRVEPPEPPPATTPPPEPSLPATTPEPEPFPPAPEPPSPAPPPPPEPAVVSDYERGLTLMRAGNFELAAVAFTVHLRQESQNQYTVAIGLFCDRDNVASRAVSAGYAPELYVLNVPRDDQSCYGMYWGLYASRAEAERGMETMPAALRSGGPVVMPLTRVVR